MHRLPLLAVAAALPLVTALQDSDVQAVFPGTTDLSSLKSGRFSNTHLTLTAVANSTHVLIVANQTDSAIDAVGWMGHGLGDAMGNADILVMWPNPDSTWTFSHRQPANHVLPRPIPYTTDPWTFVPALTSTHQSGTLWTSVAFVRSLTFPSSAGYTTTSSHTSWALSSGQGIVWSFSHTSPGSADSSAVLQQHDIEGLGTIDLSQAYSPSSSSSSGGGGSGGGDDDGSGSSGSVQGSLSTRYNMLLAAHAVFGSLTFLVISPAAILIGRYLRNVTWFPSHMWLQFGTLIFVWITFSLGYSAAKDSKFNQDTHHYIGIILPLLVSAQGVIGSWAHWSKRDSSAARPAKNWLHIIFGLGVQGLGYSQIRLGFAEWTRKAGLGEGRVVPHGIIIVFWILLGLECAAYVAGIALSPKTFLGRPNAGATRSRRMDGEK